MIERINSIYNEIYNDLRNYIKDNSKYNPFVGNKEPNEKRFPVVVIKDNYKDSTFTNLKYGETIYYIDLEINVYAIQSDNIPNNTIANELTNIIETYFYDNFKLNIKVSKNIPNIDSLVYRNLINVRMKLDTKYKDKIMISPV